MSSRATRSVRLGVLPALVMALVMAACTDVSPEVTAASPTTLDTPTTGVPPPTPADPPPSQPSSGVPTSATTSPLATAPTSPTTGPGTGCHVVPLGSPSTTATTVATPPTTLDPAGDGIGDALFPGLGNPGVDVQHYDVQLTYNPRSKALSGVVTAMVTFTQALAAFNFDAAQAVVVSSVSVDGVATPFTHDAEELRMTPSSSIERGSTHTVTITFDSDKNGRNEFSLLPSGWFDTATGSYNLNEPDGARLWLPTDDHPSDKATWTFTIKVPIGTTAVANGALADHQSTNGTDTWVWQETRPMTTYVVQVLTGPYDIVNATGPHGLPLVSAVLRADHDKVKPYLDGIADEITFFEQSFGPYPLDRYGIAVTDKPGGLAMEDQERSLFSRDDLGGALGSGQQLLLSHELAHQWFGDAVAPARWQDVWLNESFATYGEWMWLEHIGSGTVDEKANSALQVPRSEPTARPTVGGLFGFDVYGGGAAALHALRRQIGDTDFFALLRGWVAANNGTSRTTEDFIALAQLTSGQDLTAFFQDWLFSAQTPKVLPC